MRIIFFTFMIGLQLPVAAEPDKPVIDQSLRELIRQQATLYTNQSGAYILEKGEESLLARAWLTHSAKHSIDVQYFIWSADNIGILAAEALLSAAERGVKVRVIVDDLLIDTSDEMLAALAAHPNVNIFIYNPQHTVGISFWQRILNLFSGFRKANQRMHDKAVIVDNEVAIIGGRNMADEYYDFDQKYNFRDRDVLLVGKVVNEISANFQRFVLHPLTMPVENLISQNAKNANKEEISDIYAGLHQYANDTENYAPAVRAAFTAMSQSMRQYIEQLAWGEATFISDPPGKNTSDTLKGGGTSTAALISAVSNAKTSVVIQSPYLVLPQGAETIFQELIKHNVTIRVNTNSLASTDNLMAFSGYLNQRDSLLDMGFEIFEFKPHPAIQQQLLERYPKLQQRAPIFAIHAKSMVIDSDTLFVGTFNFDPRSAHLNTEIGVLLTNNYLAQQVEQAIETDMRPENSWNARSNNADAHAGWFKRFKAFLLSLLPLEPLL